jgi:hypothetical protein
LLELFRHAALHGTPRRLRARDRAARPTTGATGEPLSGRTRAAAVEAFEGGVATSAHLRLAPFVA